VRLKNSTGNASGVCVRPTGRARGEPLARFAGQTHAGQIAFHIGEKHRHAGPREAFGHQLQRARLSGAGRAGDHAVAIHHAQRHADGKLGCWFAVTQDMSDVDGGRVEAVCDAVGLVEGHGDSLSRTRRPCHPERSEGPASCPAKNRSRRPNKAGPSLRSG
jgi:hypothetical protein